MLAASPPPSDRASDALSSDDPWRPFVDGLSSFIDGVETDRLSARDFTAYESAAGDNNWRLPGGCGAFIASLGAAVPASLGTKVHSVMQDEGVTIGTDRGTIHARAAIVALSTSILAGGAIRFEPSVDDHLHAAASLPLGHADKVFLSLADPDAVPPESHLLGRFDRSSFGSQYLRPWAGPSSNASSAGRKPARWKNGMPSPSPSASCATCSAPILSKA